MIIVQQPRVDKIDGETIAHDLNTRFRGGTAVECNSLGPEIAWRIERISCRDDKVIVEGIVTATALGNDIGKSESWAFHPDCFTIEPMVTGVTLRTRVGRDLNLSPR